MHVGEMVEAVNLWKPESARSRFAFKGCGSLLASANNVKTGGDPSVSSSVSDVSAVTDHAMSSELSKSSGCLTGLSQRIDPFPCLGLLSELGVLRTLLLFFLGRLRVVMAAIDDDAVVSVVIYTITVMCMILLWCCEMLGKVVVVNAGLVYIRAFKLQARLLGFWQVLLQAPEVNYVKKPRRKYKDVSSDWQLFVPHSPCKHPNEELSVVQPQARPLVSGRVRNRRFVS